MSRPQFSPVLEDVARELENTRSAASICDANWNLVWVSDELKVLLGEEDETKLGYGLHLVEAWLTAPWSAVTREEDRIFAAAKNIPWMAWDTPGKGAAIQEIVERVGTATGWPVGLEIEALPPPPLWNSELTFIHGDLPPAEINSTIIRLHDKDGTLAGYAQIYSSRIPARIMAFVARGSEEMFGRMARIYHPGRHAAAVLFVDLEKSTQLARRLSSASYFMLIRELTTLLDDTVIEHKGIVGKHAGDGITAFFLSNDAGSPSRAAHGAISAGLKAADAVKAAAGIVADSTGSLIEGDLQINVACHWGPNLYIGQLVSGGRLEVTALGDEVNQCARIQQAAKNGEILVSKTLIEQLDDGDAADLGVTPASLRYRTVSELPDAPEKAISDAGGIPVVALKADQGN